MADQMFIAQQMNRAFQLFAQGLALTDSQAMEIADLYEPWAENKVYKTGMILKHGTNADGEAQLYTVLQDHQSQADWEPDKAASLFKPIGFTDSGLPVWTQPLGAGDAYNTGDKVEHGGKAWVSTVDSNVWEPGVYGWEETA
mgnify:CR=1 FL=1